jgi:pimeloyl-ACP methyl ester carboxylesterase
MKILSLVILGSLASFGEATQLKYKQLGSNEDEGKRPATQVESGNAVMKRLPTDGSELEFKIGKNDSPKVVLVSNEGVDLDVSIALPNGKFKKIKDLKDEGNPGAAGVQDIGKGKNLNGQGIKLKNENKEGGVMKIKATVKSNNGNKNRQSLEDIPAVAIVNHGSDLAVCFKPESIVNYVGVEASFKVALCDKTTEGIYPNALTAGSLVLSSSSADDVAVDTSESEDGWATVSFTPDAASSYTLEVTVLAKLDDEEIERQVISGTEVVVKELESVNSVALELVGDDDNFAIGMTTSLNVSPGYTPAGDETYLVNAEIHGSAGYIMSASGLADLESDNTLKSIIQVDWFHEASGPFSVQSIIISTSSGTVALVVQDNVDTTSNLPDSIPQNVRRRLQESDEDRQRRMQMGVLPEPELPEGGLRKLATVDKRILSHGWCSPTNPWSGTSLDDSNAITFLDSEANRSNDEFARGLRTFAANKGVTGCGIVAHSQGGLAALHLYTLYWSCLDYANVNVGGRMIQSVGSPYQGTPLAGNLAALAELFGAVPCGYQNDLTTSGATNWLANIPSWARKQVHYYTTSFTENKGRGIYDYCNIVTDPFLSNPDDGVVEKGRGQLSGANNEGHTTGYCHFAELMRDPSQVTTPTLRNDDMKEKGRY